MIDIMQNISQYYLGFNYVIDIQRYIEIKIFNFHNNNFVQ